MLQQNKPKWFSSTWKFLLRYWNSLLASVAVLGYLIMTQVPVTDQKLESFFIFLGLNAIIWTLIELKFAMDIPRKTSWYRSMRTAQEDILVSIRQSIKKSHNKPLFIYIIGGRIRTVSDMLEGLFQDIIYGNLSAKNVNFLVCCVNPSAMQSWRIDTLKNPVGFQRKMKACSEEVHAQIEELTLFNEHDMFRNNRIEISIIQYDSFPMLYAFVIDNTEIYWGYYTWNTDNEDFDGPSNPCYRVSKSNSTFESYREWFVNRIQFLQIARPTTVSLLAEPDSGVGVGSSDALDHVLRTNRKAYDSLASFYGRTGASRAIQMQKQLEPFYVEVNRRFQYPISLLELGPGDGSLSSLLEKKGYKVTVIDFSSRMCEHIKKNSPDVEIIEEEFCRFDFEERRFHTILAVAFVHLFPTPWDFNVLQKIRNLLYPEGIAYLSTTIHSVAEEGYSPKSEPPEMPIRYRKRYKREHFERLLLKAGLQIVHNFDSEDGFVGGKKWMNFIVSRALSGESK